MTQAYLIARGLPEERPPLFPPVAEAPGIRTTLINVFNLSLPHCAGASRCHLLSPALRAPVGMYMYVSMMARKKSAFKKIARQRKRRPMVMHVLMFSSFWRVLSSSEWSDSNGLNRHSPFLSFRCKEKKDTNMRERQRNKEREGMREREKIHMVPPSKHVCLRAN